MGAPKLNILEEAIGGCGWLNCGGVADTPKLNPVFVLLLAGAPPKLNPPFCKGCGCAGCTGFCGLNILDAGTVGVWNGDGLSIFGGLKLKFMLGAAVLVFVLKLNPPPVGALEDTGTPKLKTGLAGSVGLVVCPNENPDVLGCDKVSFAALPNANGLISDVGAGKVEDAVVPNAFAGGTEGVSKAGLVTAPNTDDVAFELPNKLLVVGCILILPKPG